MDRSEIALFDLETTRPSPEHKWTIIEFGVILICPQKLVELDRFCTLIRPSDLSLIPETRAKSNGITRDAVANEPKFEEVADTIYEYLNGRVWAGHNIVRWDSVCIREAFDEIRRPPPEAKELIDSFPLLEDKFGCRAGDMKMATLANYFGLGSQKHRSIDDIEMNLEVLKSCATVLFLQSNFPNVLGAAILSESPDASTSQSSKKLKTSTESIFEEKYEHLLELHEISLRTTFVPSQWGTRTHKMTLLHKDIPLRMRSIMKIRFDGIKSPKFFDPTRKPRLSFVVEPSSETCDVLNDCDSVAQNLFSGCNDKSEWKPLVITKYRPNPVIRIHIETAGSGETSTYSTDLYGRNSEGTTQRLASKTVDIDELDKLFVYGRSVDAEYNFDIYHFQQQAGIRLVAKRLTLGC